MRIGRETRASQQRSKAFMYSLGLVGLALALTLVWVGFNSPNSIPGRAYYSVDAEFADADNVSNHSQVRIKGKLVGQVLNLRARDGKALVELQLDPKYGPLKTDTRVEVRPRSAVGVRYVDIVPGTMGAPIPEGGRIPAANTEATRALDEVLGTFDARTRSRTQKLLRELGGGTMDRGEDLNATLGEAPRFLTDGRSVLDEIASRDGGVRRLIRGSATVAGTAEPVREQILRGFEPGRRALKAFTDARDPIQDTLDVAPQALPEIRGGLVGTDPLVRELSGLARQVRPVLAAAPASFEQASALVAEARPSLRVADRTLALARRAVDPTLDLLAAVRPVLPDLDGTFANLGPIVGTIGEYRCDFKRMGDNWGSMLGFENAGGSFLRFNVVSPGVDSLYGSSNRVKTINPVPGPGCVAGKELKGGSR
jgi:virulence factor Mce-like protein